MKKMIRLRDITEARDFVTLTSQFSERMELCDGETTVDATSIVGFFVLTTPDRYFWRSKLMKKEGRRSAGSSRTLFKDEENMP